MEQNIQIWTERLTLCPLTPNDGDQGRKHHGRGIMHEAAGALISHVFVTTDLDQIGTDHFQGNHASRAVLTGLGFRDTGKTETAHCVSRDCDEVLIKLSLSRALIDHCWATYDWPIIRADGFADNPASAHVLKKLGFAELQGSMGHSVARGDSAPLLVFQLLRPES